jgi:hypothetical protein
MVIAFSRRAWQSLVAMRSITIEDVTVTMGFIYSVCSICSGAGTLGSLHSLLLIDKAPGSVYLNGRWAERLTVWTHCSVRRQALACESLEMNIGNIGHLPLAFYVRLAGLVICNE